MPCSYAFISVSVSDRATTTNSNSLHHEWIHWRQQLERLKTAQKTAQASAKHPCEFTHSTLICAQHGSTSLSPVLPLASQVSRLPRLPHNLCLCLWHPKNRLNTTAGIKTRMVSLKMVFPWYFQQHIFCCLPHNLCLWPIPAARVFQWTHYALKGGNKNAWRQHRKMAQSPGR